MMKAVKQGKVFISKILIDHQLESIIEENFISNMVFHHNC